MTVRLLGRDSNAPGSDPAPATTVVLGHQVYQVQSASNARIGLNDLPLGAVPNPASNPTAPAPNPPHLNITSDAIGQPIPLTLGHVRLALKPIWVKGLFGNDTAGAVQVNSVATTAAAALAGDTSLALVDVPDSYQQAFDSGPLYAYTGNYYSQITGVYDTTISLAVPLPNDLPAGALIGIYTPTGSVAAPTITAAFALCQPIDPSELGNITAFYDGSNKVYSLDEGGLLLPSTWTVAQQGQLTAALNGAEVYPGTEAQLPAPLIVAERGAAKTPAFRGLRYIIIQDYPLVGNGLNLTIIWRRRNHLVRRPPPTRPNRNSSNITAVQFGAGTS